ncbi:MAG TPA: tetratricopeptide repeat protein [Spirochaetes bacterium]|nr:tetratricopeptide repeat protein [Spirochaetota bacterium]
MNPLKNHHSPLTIMSDTLVRLRKSFFRTEGLHLDISFDSPDVIKSFYYNLLVFYLFIIKYENSHLECLVALALARDLAEQIPKIDSKWVADKLEEPKEADRETAVSKSRVKVAAISTLSLAIIILSVWFVTAYLSKPTIPLHKLEEADKYASENLCSEALVIYKELLDSISLNDNKPIYAKIKYSEGKCYYSEALIKNREKNLKKAGLAFEETIQFINRDKRPIQYSNAVNHLSVVYYHLAEVRDKAGYADKAIKILKPVYEMNKRQNRPFLKAKTQTNLGIAYWRLSQVRDKLKNVNQAISLFKSALKVLDEKKSPMEYAKTQHYLGNAYGEFFRLNNGTESLDLAIEAYEKALRIRTLENHPQEYSWTQNNLGIIYRNLAYTEGNTNPKEQINKAIQIYQETLKVKTLKNYPFDYARTQINLGQGYLDLANVSSQHDKEKNLGKAVQVYQDLLKKYHAEKYPIYYASANLNLGTVFYFLSEDKKLVSQKEEDLRKSIMSYKNALRIFTIQKYPVNYARIQKNLIFVYNDLADIKNKEENYQNALKASAEALSILTSANHPVDFKIINEVKKSVENKLMGNSHSK